MAWTEEARRAWKEANPAKVKANKRLNLKRRTASKRLFVHNYLSSHSCTDCGESDPVVLEFDHVRGKKRFRVSAMMVSWCSLDTLVAEISKCEVRCANCHRRKHSKDQGWYKQ